MVERRQFVNHKLVDAVIIGSFREFRVIHRNLHTVFKVFLHLEDFLHRHFAVADGQEEVALLLTVGDDLALFQDVDAHEIQAEQVHRVLAKMVLILLVVVMPDFIEIRYRRADAVLHSQKVAELHMVHVEVDVKLAVFHIKFGAGILVKRLEYILLRVHL